MTSKPTMNVTSMRVMIVVLTIMMIIVAIIGGFRKVMDMSGVHREFLSIMGKVATGDIRKVLVPWREKAT